MAQVLRPWCLSAQALVPEYPGLGAPLVLSAQFLTRRQPPDNLTDCESAIAAFEPAAGCSLPRPGRHRRSRRGSRRRRPPAPGERWWADLFSESTGDPTTAGSAAASPASDRAAPSRTWWPAGGRRRRCAARRTRRLPRLPLGASLAGPGGGLALRALPSQLRPPVPKIECGRRFVKALGPGPGGHRTFASIVLLTRTPASVAFAAVAPWHWQRTSALHLAVCICGSSYERR